MHVSTEEGCAREARSKEHSMAKAVLSVDQRQALLLQNADSTKTVRM